MESTVVWQTRYSKKNTITDVIQPTLTLKVTITQVEVVSLSKCQSLSTTVLITNHTHPDDSYPNLGMTYVLH